MKNLHDFLSEYSNCIICNQNALTEMLILFDSNSGIKITVDYIRDEEAKSCFKYIKYRDDNDRKYDSGFDRAPNSIMVSKDGSFILDNNELCPNSYVLYGGCPNDHVKLEIGEVSLKSLVEHDREINIRREEIYFKNYRISNDYKFNSTKVYLDDRYPAKLTTKLIPCFGIKRENLPEIITKIESLLILI